MKIQNKIGGSGWLGDQVEVGWWGWWWGVRVDVNALLGLGVIWGMGDVNQEKKVFYNVQKGIVKCKKIKKKCGGGGEREGQYLSPKHSQCIKNNKNNKKVKKK